MDAKRLLNFLRDKGKPELLTIDYDEKILTAIELMITNDYSQIPITKTENIIGVISQESIIKWLCGKGGKVDLNTKVSHAMEDKKIMDPETKLGDLIEWVTRNNYVLIKEEDKYYIVTNHGILQYFRYFSEVFMLLEKIEKSLRSMISTKLPQKEFRERADNALSRPNYTPPKRVDDMNFNDYHTFLSKNRDCFQNIDNFSEFLESLENIRKVRNKVVHFRDIASIMEIEFMKQFEIWLESTL